MQIQVSCGNCGRAYAVKPELAGRKVKCSACGGTFLVPVPQPKEPELVELNDLSSFEAPLSSGIDLSSPGLTSQAVRQAPRSESSGMSTPVLAAIIVGAVAGVLVLAAIVIASLMGGDEKAPSAGAGATADNSTPQSGASSSEAVSSASSGTTSPAAAESGRPSLAVAAPAAAVKWSVVADPAPAGAGLTSSPLRTGKATKLLFARRDAAIALACRDDYSTAGGVVHAEKFNLASGQSLGSVQFPAKDRVMGLSADGKHVLVGSNGYEGSGFEFLKVWSWSADRAEEAASWNPYPKPASSKTVWATMPRAHL
jgi:hypothetical protein